MATWDTLKITGIAVNGFSVPFSQPKTGYPIEIEAPAFSTITLMVLRFPTRALRILVRSNGKWITGSVERATEL